MKKFLYSILSVAIVSTLVWAASTTTTNYGLTKTDVGDTGWGPAVNTNFDTIDSQMKSNADNISSNSSSISTNTSNISTNTSAISLNTAKVTESTTASSPLVKTGYSISIPQADTSTSGYISSTDWNTFNNKVSNATHTGEVTGATALTITDNIIDEANLKLDTAPTNDYVLTADDTASGGLKWAASGSGSGTPGGSDTQIQYNNAGAFGGDAGMTYDDTLNKLTVDDIVTGSVVTGDTELVLTQTGDTFGTTSLSLRNRTGANGALFSSASLDLVDFAFKPSVDVQSNIRYEGRSTDVVSSSNSREFQFIDDATGTPTFALSVGTGNSKFHSPLTIGSYTLPNTDGTANQALITDGSGSVSWGSVSGSSPLTTKGDIYGYSTTDARLGVGTDGYVLKADSSQPTGLIWAIDSTGGSGAIDTTQTNDATWGNGTEAVINYAYDLTGTDQSMDIGNNGFTVSNTLTSDGLTIGLAVIEESELEILDGATLTTTELNYVDGVTSSIQTQINAKGDMLQSVYDIDANNIVDKVDTNANLTGDITSVGNATTIASGVIVNADINSSASIDISKTALVAGTNITLSTNTLNVDDAFITNNADDTMAGNLTVQNTITVDYINSTGGTTTVENTLYVDTTSTPSGISFPTVDSDPCSTFGEGGLFYNGTAFCFCDGTNATLIYDTTTDCF